MRLLFNFLVVSTAKVQKIWEQFTTRTTLWISSYRCFDCKSTKNLRAIHNFKTFAQTTERVVSTAKVQKIWEQFTTYDNKYYNELGCFDCKSTKNLRAIHNRGYWGLLRPQVVSTAKVQKIWEQFTTISDCVFNTFMLFRLQKYKKFESNSQLHSQLTAFALSCFDCKSTKNLRAIHNAYG